MKKTILFCCTLLFLFIIESFFITNIKSAEGSYFLPIKITTGSSIKHGYSLSFTFNNKELIEKNLSKTDGSNIRMYYDSTGLFQGSEKEIDIYNEESFWESDKTKIWFKSQSDLGENGEYLNLYRLYLNKIEESNVKRNPNNVYYLFNDFSSSDLTNWENFPSNTSWIISEDVLKSPNNGSELLYKNTGINGYYLQAKIKNINDNQYVGVIGSAKDLNDFYLFNWDRNANDWRLNYFNSNWNFILSSENDFQKPQSGDVLSLSVLNSGITGYRNSKEIFKYNIQSEKNGGFGFFTGGENSETLFDDLIVRLQVQDEPVVSVATSSVTLTPTPSISETTVTPSITETPAITTTVTPTISLTYTITPSITPTNTLTVTPTPTDIPTSYSKINIFKAESFDTDTNGKIDKIVVNFSGLVDLESATTSDFSVKNYWIKNLSFENGDLIINLFESSYFDTGMVLELFFNGINLKDLNGDLLKSDKIFVKDKAIPYLLLNNTGNESNSFDSSVNINGVSSDYSSNENSFVVLTKIFYKKNNSEKWFELASINNENFQEPFEWKFESSEIKETGTYDFLVESYDLEGNASAKYFTLEKIQSVPSRVDFRSTTHLLNSWSNEETMCFEIIGQKQSVDKYHYLLNDKETDSQNYNELPGSTQNYCLQVNKNGEYSINMKSKSVDGLFSDEVSSGLYLVDINSPQISWFLNDDHLIIEIIEKTPSSGIKNLNVNYWNSNYSFYQLFNIQNPPSKNDLLIPVEKIRNGNSGLLIKTTDNAGNVSSEIIPFQTVNSTPMIKDIDNQTTDESSLSTVVYRKKVGEVLGMQKDAANNSTVSSELFQKVASEKQNSKKITTIQKRENYDPFFFIIKYKYLILAVMFLPIFMISVFFVKKILD